MFLPRRSPPERQAAVHPGPVEPERDVMTTKVVTLRCMKCGHQYQEVVAEGEDKERSCPQCRSNSIRLLKKPPPEAGESR